MGKRRVYLSHDQVATLAECSAYSTLVLTLAHTGLRWGEATGLRVRRVNRLRRRFVIEDNAVFIAYEIEVGMPKTHEKRSMPDHRPPAWRHVPVSAGPADAEALRCRLGRLQCVLKVRGTMSNHEEAVPVWTLATQEVAVPNLLDGIEGLTAARLAELRTALATLAESPIATLECHPIQARRDPSGGIALNAASPLAQQLARLVSDTAKASPRTMTVASQGEVLYRMVIPAKVAAQVGKGLVQPMAAKTVAGGIYGGLRGATGIVANAAFVPVAGKAAATGAGAAAGSAVTAGATAATAGALTVAAPLVLMAVAVAAAAYADHERQKAIERITTLLEQLHEQTLDNERNQLDGSRDAIDKATSILLDQGRPGHSLGLDSSAYEINKAFESAKRRVKKWTLALDSLQDGPVEVSELGKSFPGVNEEGGLFRAHLELARLAIALKRRVLVLQAVEHAQQDTGNPFLRFVDALRADERRLEELSSSIDSVLMRLSTLKLKRQGGLRLPTFTPGEVDALLQAAYRVRALGDEVSATGAVGDVAIEIERGKDGALVVFPAVAA